MHKLLKIIIFIVTFFTTLVSMDTVKRKKLIPIEKKTVPLYMFEQFSLLDDELQNGFLPIDPNSSVRKITKSIHKLTKKLHQNCDQKYLEKATIQTMQQYALFDILSYIEGYYLLPSTPFLNSENYIAQIIHIHERLTRLTSPKAGQFRQGNVWHRIKELTPTERLFHAALEKPTSLTTLRLNQFSYFIKSNTTNVQDIKDLLVMYEMVPSLRPINLKPMETISIDEIDVWAEENGSVEDQTINITEWLKKRYSSQSIAVELRIIPSIANQNMHTIKKAALIWYHLARINPFNDCNNLTAYLIASIILLRNGYLPPALTEIEDHQTLLEDCFAKNDPKPFFLYLRNQIILKHTLNKSLQCKI